MDRLASLEVAARRELQATLTQQDSNADGNAAADSIVVTRYLSCRYSGTDTAMMISTEGQPI